jgi:signal peptidase I
MISSALHPDPQSNRPLGEPIAALPAAAEPVPVAHATLSVRSSILFSIQSLINIIIVAIFIITFTVQPFRIPSGSMEPTLLIGDFLLVTKVIPSTNPSNGIFPSSRIHRGDIIVFHYPVDLTMDLVKRVIGLPGDRVKLRDGRVYINDALLKEPYAMYRPSPPDSFRDNFPRLQNADPNIESRWWIRMHNLIENGELIIPAGNYFVLGDNRNDSEDSRYWGFVPRGNIVGKPLLIYFSLHQGDDASLFAGIAAAQTSIPQHPGKLTELANFARWDRTLQIVR